MSQGHSWAPTTMEDLEGGPDEAGAAPGDVLTVVSAAPLVTDWSPPAAGFPFDDSGKADGTFLVWDTLNSQYEDTGGRAVLSNAGRLILPVIGSSGGIFIGNQGLIHSVTPGLRVSSSWTVAQDLIVDFHSTLGGVLRMPSVTAYTGVGGSSVLGDAVSYLRVATSDGADHTVFLKGTIPTIVGHIAHVEHAGATGTVTLDIEGGGGSGTAKGVELAPGDSALVRRRGSTAWEVIATHRAGATAIVDTLPSLPPDRTEIDFATAAMLADGVIWRLRYIASLDKWAFMGGDPLTDYVAAADNTASNGYTDLSGGSLGPAVTVPLAMTCRVQVGSHQWNNDAGGGAFMSYDVGATGAVDADAVEMPSFATDYTPAVSPIIEKNVAALADIVGKYKRTGGSGFAAFKKRWIRVEPVLIDGV